MLKFTTQNTEITEANNDRKGMATTESRCNPIPIFVFTVISVVESCEVQRRHNDVVISSPVSALLAIVV